jgi:hypothetical protein
MENAPNPLVLPVFSKWVSRRERYHHHKEPFATTVAWA